MTSSNPGNNSDHVHYKKKYLHLPQHLALSPRQQPRRLTTAVQTALSGGGCGLQDPSVQQTRSLLHSCQLAGKKRPRALLSFVVQYAWHDVDEQGRGRLSFCTSITGHT